MTDCIVWLDSKNAHVFAFGENGFEKSIVSRNEHDHHAHNKKDRHGDSDSEHYHRDLAKALKGAEKVLLMGPGLAKNHFKDHLTTHQANTLAKKIIGLENFEGFEHKTEKQFLAKARESFESYGHVKTPV